jgi:hypothetical protein
MTESIPVVRRDRNQRERVPWVNEAGEEIPEFACIKLTGRTATGRKVYEAEKPDGDGSLHFANGPAPVADTARSSSGLWNLPRQVMMDDGVTLGATIGPQADSWKMGVGGSGFVCFREPVNGVGVAIKEGGGGPSIRHAEVIACLGNGYYQMQLSTSHAWDVPEQTYEIGESGYAEDECDLCTFVDDSEGANCGDIIKQPDREQMSGDSTLIFAYDPRAIPLEIPGHAIVIAGGATVPDGIYGYDYYGEDTPLWFVLNGTYPIVGIPHETWECCVDPDTGVEFIKLTKCDVYMVEGVLCPGIEDPCPGDY